MINHSSKALYQKAYEVKRQIKSCKNLDERVALQNYLGNLYDAIHSLGDTKLKVDKNKCFGNNKEYQQFVRKLQFYDDQMMANYSLCKDFHKDFLGEVIPDVEEELQDLCPLTFSGEKDFHRKESVEILYAFFQSIGLEKFFDDFYQNNKIYSARVENPDDSYIGCTLFNPKKLDADVLVFHIKNNIKSLGVIVHELGHVYDMKENPIDISHYNQFFYSSFYGETISRLFERLFFRFLVKNNIKTGDAKNSFVDFEFLNHDFLLSAYIFSLLSMKDILSEDYLNWDNDTFYAKIKSYFVEDADMSDTISYIKRDDFSEIYNYAYGDIISMFLADEIEKSGLLNEMMEYFLAKRSHLFSEEFMRECGFGPENYMKSYQKEIELIKK